MAWVAVYQQLLNHKKLRKFSKKLDVSRHEAIGVLVSLWAWALDNTDKTGELEEVTKEDIAEAIFWKGDVKKLYDALIKSEFLEEVDGKIYLHDWYDFNKPFYDYIDKKKRDVIRKKSKLEGDSTENNSTEIPRKFHGNSTESRRKFHGVSMRHIHIHIHIHIHLYIYVNLLKKILCQRRNSLTRQSR
jgi:hypothetical protein